jgi:hypothetical protein
MKTRALQIVLAVLIACNIGQLCRDSFALSSTFSGNASGADWPKGLAELVNTTNRVYGFWVNSESMFFFSGSAADFTVFLQDYAKIEPVVKHELILHDGAPEHKSPFAKDVPAFDWELYACPKGWIDVGNMVREGKTNSIEELRSVAQNSNYIMKVDFWIGGRVPFEQVRIPQSVEVKRAK